MIRTVDCLTIPCHLAGMDAVRPAMVVEGDGASAPQQSGGEKLVLHGLALSPARAAKRSSQIGRNTTKSARLPTAKTSCVVSEPQQLGSSLGRHVEELADRGAGALGHLDAVDVADDVEQAQRGAGAYVRAQRSRDSARACSVVAEQSAAEEKVGAWAVNEARARGAEQLELFGAEVDPMRSCSERCTSQNGDTPRCSLRARGTGGAPTQPRRAIRSGGSA